MRGAAARQADLEHLAPLIGRLVDGMADLAVMRAAGIYLDPAVSRRDRLQALLALLRFAERGGAGSTDARVFLTLAQAKRLAG